MQNTSGELSEREREILYLVATGASNKEIAQQLSISTNTVKVHLRNIFAKINVRSRTEAAMHAVSVGLVPEQTPIIADSGARGTGLEVQVLADEQSPRKWWMKAAWPVGLVILALAVVAVVYAFLRPEQSPSQEAPIRESPRWQSLPPMPTARSGLAIVAHEQAIYAIGGKNAQSVSRAVERYDPVTRLWTAASPKPTPVYEIGAAVISGKIYVPGGRLASDQVSNVLEIYDPRLDVWTTGSPLPLAISAYGLAAFEGRLFLFGGWNGRDYLASVYEYDPDQDRWQEKTPMPTPRGNMGVGQVGGSLYVIGGFDGKNGLRINEVYKPDLDDGSGQPWSKAAELPESCYRMGVASSIDMLLVVGGVRSNVKSAFSFQYSVQNDEWRRFDNPSTPHSWYDLGATVLATQLYIMGGELDQHTTDQSMAYQVLFVLSLPVVPVQQP